MQLPSAADIDRVATPSQPLVARHRLAFADTDGLVDLAAHRLELDWEAVRVDGGADAVPNGVG